ncbi:MAG: HyaD/HybD family hydrogenase maturation endopeptidase [Acidiferrobacterales bacterium]|nr:HyaD/HybD family hydrogenase maturation endopeptidase [Acidiferrobacterales bacterium]
MREKTLILGLGNTLLGDEGIGVHAIEHLRNYIHHSAPDLEEQVELLDGGTLSFTLAAAIEDSAQLIVIDATNLDAAPGTVRVFEGDEMDAFLGTGKRSSVHEVSLLDLMAVAALTGHLPEQRALVSIQPENIDWSDTPTPAVRNAIPTVCDHVIELVECWKIIPAPIAESFVDREQVAGEKVTGVQLAGEKT